MKYDLTKGNVTTTMLRFAVPMILGNVLQQCYNLADTWIVGRFVGSGALAAVGSAYTLMTFLNSLIIGMCMGSGALFSISYGRRDIRKMKEYIVASFVLILGITVAITAVSFVMLDPILNVMQIPEDVYDMMFAYVKIILYGLVFIFLYNYFSFLLRSTGNSVVPLIFLGVSTVLNIILDYIFVAVLDRGVEGAAEATVIAQIISGVGIGIYSMIKEPVLRRQRVETVREDSRIRIHASVLGEIFSYSAATGVQQSVMNFGILMVQGLVNSFGTTVMAAFAAAVKIDSFAYMPAQEYANAFSTFLAQNAGAGRADRVKQGVRCAFITSLSYCAAASLALWILAEPLMQIFVAPTETQIIWEGVRYLRIEGAFYCGIGLLFLLYGLYRALGKPAMSLALTIVSLGTRVVLANVLAAIPSIGVVGIWWSVPIGWFLADVTGLCALRLVKRAGLGR